MKKVISVVTLICMLTVCFASVVPVLSFAEELAETVVLTDGFDEKGSYVNSMTYPWTVYEYGGDYGSVAKFVAKSDTSSANGWINWWGKAFDEVYSSGKVMTSFDINCDTYIPWGVSLRGFLRMGYTTTQETSYSSATKYWGFGMDSDANSSSVLGDDVNLRLRGTQMPSNEKAAGTEVKMAEKQWYHIDMVIDFTAGKHYCYIDGVAVSEWDLPSDFTQVGSFGIGGMLAGGDSLVYLDNLEIIHNPEAAELDSVTVDEAAKTIEVKYTKSLSASQELKNENVSVIKCGTDETVEIKSVSRPFADTIRITYDDNTCLEAGREYKVVFRDGITSAFGDVVTEVPLFNAKNNVTSTQVTQNFNGTFETTFPTDEFWENQGYTGATIEYVDNTSAEDKALKMSKTDVTAGTHLYFEHKPDITNNKKGRLSYAFDYKIDSESKTKGVRIQANSASYYLMNIAANGNVTFINTDTTALAVWDYTKWHRVEIVFDYIEQEEELYLDEKLLGTKKFSDIDVNFTGDIGKSIGFITWLSAGSGATHYWDNFCVKYEETTPTVSGVRYIDASGNEQLGDTLAEGMKQINVNFNTPMQTISATLNGEAVTGALSEDGLTYTIAQEFAKKPGYALSISGTSAAGMEMSAPVVYSFTVGTTTVSSAEKAAAVSVDFGTAFENANLPSTVVGTDENGNTVNVPVVWSKAGYWNKTPGTYTLTGSLTAPVGYALAEGLVGSIDVTVGADTATEEIVDGIEVRMSESAQTPLNTGAFLQTDTLQMGIEAGTITVSSDDFTSLGGIADAEGGSNGGVSAVTSGDGEIEIAFTESYDGSNKLSDMRIVFEDLSADAGQAGWNLELLYKNSSGEWIKFYKNEKAYPSRSFDTYPALIIRGLAEKLTDVKGLKIRLLGRSNGYKLLEADVNMVDDGSVTEAKRDEYTTPIRFANLLSDNAVIQRDKPVKIWGYGGMSGDEITVSIKNGDTIVRSAKAISDGEKWEAALDAMEGSLTEYTITAECGENKAEIANVLFGDVFLASGQSNMAYALGNVYNRLTALNTTEARDYRDEIVAMADEELTGLRFYSQTGGERLGSLEPLEDEYLGEWIANGNYHGGVYNASAVAYFFAYDLYNKLGKTIPVAFIEAARGGTSIKAWMDEKTYNSVGLDTLTDDKIVSHNPGSVNTGCWNAMVAPFTKQAFKGVIWYQGEGDHAQYENYDKWFEALHKGWQNAFNDDTLTFTTVQIADWDGQSSSAYYPEFRQTQLQIWLKNEGMVNMVSAVDVGENDNDASNSDDIHPLYKTPVGQRLAAAVWANLYGKDIEYFGPLFDKVTKAEDGLEISFTHAEGLKAQSRSSQYKEEFTADEYVNGFETSADGIEWTAAAAEIVDGKVKVTCDSAHTYVRYAWNDWNGNLNLYNDSNYPAVPFMASSDMSEILVSETETGIKVSVPVKNMLKLTGKLIAAKYDKTSGILAKAEVNDASFILNDTDIEYNFDITVGEDEYVKVMLFDGLDTIRPLAKFGETGK